MSEVHNWKTSELIFAILAIFLVLFVYGAIPFLMLPTLGQAVWTTGFSLSMANGTLFDFYAHDFGIPKPAAIAFGLAGAWPTSLLIRLGLHPADAYAGMAALWLCLAMFSAYSIVRRFGGTNLNALLGAVIWMTMPIIWAHAAYSMVSLGIALLSFYFLAIFNLFLIDSKTTQITPAAIALYVTACIVSVFMDGYTFMMFASASSILLIYSIFMRPEIRSALIKIAVPVHVCSFALAYALYSLYIGRLNFEASHIDFFRGWGLDLSFIAIPTKGVLWLPDLLGISVKRTGEVYFGDASVWITTFALPVLLLGLFAWSRARHRIKISTGILLVSIFGFYMALGPSLKINSTKPEALQLSQPCQRVMAPEYAVAPTGNAWISEKLPGFNVMRASYRWSALGIFTMWLLIVICLSKTDRKSARIWLGFSFFLLLFNLPDFENKWRRGVNNRIMFQQIDRELIAELGQNIRSNETVVFIPSRNDFFANYLAPKAGFRTFNIGGDKNLAAAAASWPQAMLFLRGKIDSSKTMASLKMLTDGDADVIVLPYFDMLWAAHSWPCGGGVCPSKRRGELQPAIAALRALPYIEIGETDLFATIRLRPEFSGPANQLALFSDILGAIRYPINIGSDFIEAPYVLEDGWHGVEAKHAWSKSEAKLSLPIPKYCGTIKCEIKLNFGVFGASPERPVDVLFNSAEQGWEWSKKITAVSSEAMGLNIPIDGSMRVQNINISILNAISPKHLTGSPDDRILGISLQRIELAKP